MREIATEINVSNFNEEEWKSSGNHFENIKLESDYFGEILTKKEFRVLTVKKKKFLEHFEVLSAFRTHVAEYGEISDYKIKEFLLDEIAKKVEMAQEVLHFEDSDETVTQRVYMDEPDFLGIEHNGYEMLITTQNWNRLIDLVTNAINEWKEN
jgi:hypothetical protein